MTRLTSYDHETAYDTYDYETAYDNDTPRAHH